VVVRTRRTSDILERVGRSVYSVFDTHGTMGLCGNIVREIKARALEFQWAEFVHESRKCRCPQSTKAEVGRHVLAAESTRGHL
jgi:hypothetical protein